MKYMILIVLFFAYLNASPAITKKIVFMQPDGTSFEGYLKGDAAFHWIESDGEIIVYNPSDKYYYKAIVDRQKGIFPSSQRVPSLGNNRALKMKARESIDVKTRETLHYLYREAKKKNGPR